MVTVKTKNSSIKQFKKAFTIVELLVVIVVIGILAAIAFVSYSGISAKAITVSIISDLDSDAKLLKLYNVEYGYYPSTIDSNTYCPTSPDVDNRYCLKTSKDNEIDYSGSGQTFTLTITNTPTEIAYTITESTGATLATGGGSGSSTNAKIVDGNPACALSDSGSLKCWIHDTGMNVSNEPMLLDSFGTPSEISDQIPLNGLTIKSMTVASRTTCAIASNDKSYCWGRNSNGEMGIDDYDLNSSTVAAEVYTEVNMNGKYFKSLSGGNNFVCGMSNDNAAYCWGNNGNGQLGINSGDYPFSPTAVYTGGVLSGKTIKVLSAGMDGSACVIASDDNPYCWGYNYYGNLGNNSTTKSTAPVAVYKSGNLSGKTVSLLSSGGDHTCVLASDTKIYCWGANGSGQLGIGSTSTRSTVPVGTVMTGVLSGKTISSIYAGVSHTCVIANDSKAYCWGGNGSGQLGDGSVTTRTSPVAVSTSGALSGKNISELALGSGFTCALSTDSNLYCWGTNYVGQFGNGTITDSLSPVQVAMTGDLSGKTLKHIYAKYEHVCAIASDDKSYCWGAGTEGQLGNNTSSDSMVPKKTAEDNVFIGETISEMSSLNDNTYQGTCVLTVSSKMYCWGDVYYAYTFPFGDNSQLASLPREIPMTGILSGKTVKYISRKMVNDNTCFIASDDKPYCWGRNLSGQFGNGSSAGEESSTPVAVDTTGVLNGKTLVKIDVGGSFVCVLDDQGHMYCWGDDYVGSLGDGNSETISAIPVAVNMSGVLAGKTIKDFSVGGGHTCVIASDDKAYCWGYGAFGELGDNTSNLDSYFSSVPVAVDMSGALSGKTIKHITSGDLHTCVIASDNKPYCWGDNGSSQMGEKSATPTFAAPVAAYTGGDLNGINLQKISASYTHTCAIGNDGGYYCWGISSSAH